MVSVVLQILQSIMVVTQTSLRVVGITDKVHPTLYFQATVFLWKKNCYNNIIPTTLVCVLFGTTIPTLSFFLHLFLSFFLSPMSLFFLP